MPRERTLSSTTLNALMPALRERAWGYSFAASNPGTLSTSMNRNVSQPAKG